MEDYNVYQYTVVEAQANNPEALQRELNELGKDEFRAALLYQRGSTVVVILERVKTQQVMTDEDLFPQRRR